MILRFEYFFPDGAIQTRDRVVHVPVTAPASQARFLRSDNSGNFRLGPEDLDRHRWDQPVLGGPRIRHRIPHQVPGQTTTELIK